MEQVRLGLEHGIDPDSYAWRKYECYEMEKMRLELEGK